MTLDDGEPVEVVLDPTTLVSWVVTASHQAADAPAAIYELADGRPERLAEQWAGPKVNREGFETFSHGLLNSVTCAEWDRGQKEQVSAGEAAFPDLPPSVWERAPQIPFHTEDCRIWNVPKAPAALKEAVESDIPALVLSGAFDAQTPASRGAYVAETLSNATVETIPGEAHGTFFESECSAQLITSFFDDPEALDTSCVAEVEPAKFNIE